MPNTSVCTGQAENAPIIQHTQTLKEINALGAQFVVVDGDATQWYGAVANEKEWDIARSYFEQYTVPVYLVQGNHEIPNTGESETNKGSYFRDFLNNRISYSEQQGRYVIYGKDANKNYYDTEINGNHFIFMTIPLDGVFSYGDEQLKWLDEKLYENEQSGKPIFVFGHVPVNQTVGFLEHWSANQIVDYAEMKAILAKHPSAVYVSGHTHLTLDTDIRNVINGDGNAPSYVHDGGIINVNVPISGDLEDVEGTMGVIIEVYSDKLLVRGRDFRNEKWIPRGQYIINLKGECPLSDLKIEKYSGDSFVSLAVANPLEDVVYTWLRDGENLNILSMVDFPSGCE